MKTMKKLFGIVLMLMVSMVTSADENDPLVKFDTNEFTGGKVVKKSEMVLPQEKEEDPVYVQVTITVTPAPGYYITKEDIVVMATYPLPPTPANETRAEGDEKKPEFASQIELVGEDNPQKLAEARNYTFTIEKGFGVWVTEANFKQAATEGKVGEVSWSLKTVESKGEADPKLILTLEGKGSASLDEGSAPWAMQKSAITNLVVSKGITAFGAGLLSGCDHLTSIEIQNAESVITLGEGAIPANEGLAVDVPGNIFNKYLMNDSWKGFNVDSKNKVLMGKVKFVKDKNQYDVFAPEQDMMVPVGAFAYTVSKIKGNELLLEDVATISKGKVVLLYSKEIQTEELYTAAVPQPTKTRANKDDEEKEKELTCELMVVPYDDSKSEEDQGFDVKLGQVYMLYNDVFYPTQAGRIPVGGIYLVIKENEEDEVIKTRSFLTIGGVADDADDAITAIDNSPLSIVHCPLSTSWYDLRGRRLNGRPTAKGVYINNGKKYVVK